jgi:cell division septation protein DedD
MASRPATTAPAKPPARGGPLSLDPQGSQQTSEPAPAAPVSRTASIPPAAPTRLTPAPATSGTGGYVVQLSSQRSEADAQASFRSLQAKFPTVLGNRDVMVKRADLGPKGTYFRAVVGPFASSGDAEHFCGSLKAAGGQCLIQKN